MTPGSSARRRSSKQAGLHDNFNPTKIPKFSDNKPARHECASNGHFSGPALAKYIDEVTQ
jgi:hypothetical protein